MDRVMERRLRCWMAWDASPMNKVARHFSCRLVWKTSSCLVSKSSLMTKWSSTFPLMKSEFSEVIECYAVCAAIWMSYCWSGQTMVQLLHAVCEVSLWSLLTFVLDAQCQLVQSQAFLNKNCQRIQIEQCVTETTLRCYGHSVPDNYSCMIYFIFLCEKNFYYLCLGSYILPVIFYPAFLCINMQTDAG